MSLFDRFAAWVTSLVARAPFFAFCAVLVFGWVIGLPFAGPSNQLYHLVLNSPTTAITFLLVALQANGTARNEKAMNQKLNAMADFLADFGEATDYDMERHVAELRKAVGIEKEVSS